MIPKRTDNNLIMLNTPRNLNDDSKRTVWFDVRVTNYKILYDNMLYL